MSDELPSEPQVSYSWRSIFWYGIFPSILTTLIFVGLIGPISGLIWNAIVDNVGSISRWFVNRTIQSAAYGHRANYAFVQLIISFAPIVTFLSILPTITLSKRIFGLQARSTSKQVDLVGPKYSKLFSSVFSDRTLLFYR
jgi:hypothetical protein